MEKEVMTLEELMSLHDKIKEHPYRLPDGDSSHEMANEYGRLMSELSRGLDYYLLKDEENVGREAFRLIEHDFNSAIGLLRNWSYIERNCSYEVMMHLEKCLGICHQIIDGVRPNYVYTRHYSAKYNEEDGKYVVKNRDRRW